MSFFSLSSRLLLRVRTYLKADSLTPNFALLDIPFPLLLKTPSLALTSANTTSSNSNDPIIFVCKKGNDSFLAAKAFRKYLASKEEKTRSSEGLEVVAVKDLVGGVQAWSREIDKGFPIY